MAAPSAESRAASVGRSSPLGATVDLVGVNFSVYASDATGIDLLLFDRAEDGPPARVISLDPFINRTFHYWHVFVPRLRAAAVWISSSWAVRSIQRDAVRRCQSFA